MEQIYKRWFFNSKPCGNFGLRQHLISEGKMEQSSPFGLA